MLDEIATELPKVVEITHLRSVNDYLYASIHEVIKTPVSYTHLDVYKRQIYDRTGNDPNRGVVYVNIDLFMPCLHFDTPENADRCV